MSLPVSARAVLAAQLQAWDLILSAAAPSGISVLLPTALTL